MFRSIHTFGSRYMSVPGTGYRALGSIVLGGFSSCLWNLALEVLDAVIFWVEWSLAFRNETR